MIPACHTTDGSGIDHRECDGKKADRLGKKRAWYVGFFYIIGKFSELSYDIKILCASRSEEIIASQSARARQKCASC